MTNIKIPDLEKILEYKNEDIIHRFMKEFSLSEIESEDIFTETKKWLYACTVGKSKQNSPRLLIDDSLLIIDEMWHNFILHTTLYFDFCNEHFGYYVHHQPTSKKEMQEFKTNFKEKYKKYKNQIQIQLEYLYDLLGEETVIKWYDIYPSIYSEKKIFELKHRKFIL
jgi:hypothetical protein